MEIRDKQVWSVRIERMEFSRYGITVFQFALYQHGHAELAHCPGVVAIEGNGLFKFGLRLGPASLNPPQQPHRPVRRRPVPVSVQCFQKQLFCTRLIATSVVLSIVGDIGCERLLDSDSRIHRVSINRQRAF